jgi:hypothetical protein
MKLPYFKITEAFAEAKDSFSYGSGSDKLASTAKLLGKSIANVGMLAVEIGADVIKKAPETAGQYAQKNLDTRAHLMTDEQIKQSLDIIEKGKASKEQRIKEEKETLQKEQEEKEELQRQEERKRFDGKF